MATALPMTSEIRFKPQRPPREKKLTPRAAKALLDAPANGFDGRVRDDIKNALDGIDESTLNQRLFRLLDESNVTELRRYLADVRAWAECAIETLATASGSGKGA